MEFSVESSSSVIEVGGTIKVTGDAVELPSAGSYEILYACSQANEWYQPPLALSASGTWSERTISYVGASGKVEPDASMQFTISFSDLYGAWSGSLPTTTFTLTISDAMTIKCQ